MRRAIVGQPAPEGAQGKVAGSGPGRPCPDAGARRAATQGVVNGLRSLYADTLSAPLSGDLKDILERFNAGRP